MKHTWKITYPDGEIEFWHDSVSDVVPELARLQKIHNGGVSIDLHHTQIVEDLEDSDAKVTKH